MCFSDFDGDGFVGEKDLAQVIQRLTQPAGYRTAEERAGYICEDEENHIIKVVSVFKYCFRIAGG